MQTIGNTVYLACSLLYNTLIWLQLSQNNSSRLNLHNFKIIGIYWLQSVSIFSTKVEPMAERVLFEIPKTPLRKDLYIWTIRKVMTTKDYILRTLNTHKAELAKFGIQNIGLFGSYVRDEQTKKSDIDILIDFNPDKESFDNYMAVYDYFENLFKNEKVEIVTRNGLSPYIGPKILKEVMYV